MSAFLLDINCIRGRPFQSRTESRNRKRFARLAQGIRRTQLETWLEVELQTRFAGRILPVDTAIADRWGVIAAEAKRRGKALSVIDGLLAATALHHNGTVVSLNASDCMVVQVQVF